MQFRALFATVLCLISSSWLNAQDYGLTTRPSFTAFNGGTLPPNASTIAGNWSTVPAFPNLTFLNPMGIAQKPGTNTMIVWEREGRVWSFDKNASTSTKTLLLDISAHCQGWDDCGLLNLAFHPNFASNGYVFLYYTYPGTIPVKGSPTVRPATYQTVYDRLARFTMMPDGTIDPNSETVLIHQKSATVWHNGSGMFFHPVDGFLYLVNGDDFNSTNAQQITKSLHSGVFRIDVDQRGGSISHAIPKQPGPVGSYTQNYFIPNDNPFVGQSGVLEEFYAIGLRSPHRMTRDPVTGRIFISDVGDESREEINVIEPGNVAANFQWPKFEGLIGDMTPPYLGLNKKPLIDYAHTDGLAVIGGYVYRGSEFPELYGKYIFGDNMLGTIWYLDESTTPASKVAICKLPNGPGPNSGESYVGLSSFGVDEAGELYLAQLSSTGGKIYKLAKTGTTSNTMPATLSATGIFSDLPNLTISPAFQRYEVNNPLWSDAAIKERWFAIPDGQKIGYAATGEWSFPQGSVFVKHFDLGTDETNPSVKRRLETRIMVRDDQGFLYGGSYRWRPDNSDADLVGDSQTESITITTASGTRSQEWLFPGRQACFACHTQASKGVLGINARQLNKDRLFTETSVTDNQLRAWNHAGYFAPAIDEASISTTPKLAALSDSASTLEHRVRSYLDSNCSHCHRPGGGARALWDARFEVPLTDAGIVDGRALNELGIARAGIVRPQDILKSILHKRMATSTEPYAMPPLAKNLVDTEAVALLEQWINALPVAPSTPLASPWTNQIVGTVATAGTANKQSDAITITGSGTGIGGASDAFQFVSQPLVGDGQLIVRVVSVSNATPSSKVGVMIRESTTATARSAATVLTPTGSSFIWRNAATSAGSSNGANTSWLRIRRSGAIFISSTSADGQTWTEIGRQTLAMGTSARIGFCVTSGDGTVTTATFDNVQFMPLVPWLITTQPQSQMVKAGQLVEFGIDTSGDAPTSYQWRKTGVAIPRAVDARYAFKAALASAGAYSVAMAGKLVSAAANLVVVDKVTYTNNLPPGGTATFMVSYAGTGATFQWLKNGSPVQNSGTRVTGATASTLSIKLLTLNDIGDYECVVKAYGNTIVLGPYHLHVLSKPSITAPAPPSWSVSRFFSWQLTANEPVTTYSVKNLPSGLTYNAATGVVSGIPNVGSSTTPYSIVVTAYNAAGWGLPTTYQLSIEPFPLPLIGKFAGLIDQDAGNNQLGGAISLTTSSNGTFTGTLAFADKSYPLNARCVFIAGSDPTISLSVARTGTTPLLVALTLDRNAGTISGTVNSIATSLRKLVTTTTAAAYNMALDLPSGLVGVSSVPQGTGWARITIATTGAITVSGATSDVIVLTSSHNLRDDGSFAWRQLIYSNKGVVQGLSTINASAITGTLGWRKTAAISTADRTYAGDFGQVNLIVDGVKWVAPVAGTTFLGNADTVGNAKIAFSRGGIELAAVNNIPNQTFRLRSNHTATFDPSLTINPNKVTLTVVPTTGYYYGGLTLKDGALLRSIIYRGIFIPGRHEAFGAFLLRQIPGTAADPILSGSVRLWDSALP